ncbi:hypothetical protein [Flavobacterium sp. 140616W15]|uniref:hypothetical protein n=1 Tax=Flavobacterium sp. 140616W15 TaxID=2478552 RepID=UPI000F0CE014|nr:hypothetical protein [Flavobacterium sp. 140616W15]AYN06607.1 hypothetical protein EAG11_09215 [Flavobacterium sp. 140616W15]
MANKTSQHILNTSANLLGFCLIVMTSLHITNKSETTHMDEFTSIISVFLIFSCFFSFLSIKTIKESLEKKLETIADYLFGMALLGILVIVVFTALDLIN